ncbi:MAG: helix-hairpin-helix domain-containing protein [Archaeoglobaceae archaeon]|nr:helix-hairpin-helix domain-containing protein [Archaeoglobaceae archaeon]
MTEELVDLEEIPGVGPETAKKLREAGFTSIEAIAIASPAELSAIGGISESNAQKIIQHARKMASIGGFESGDKVLEKRRNVRKI